MTILKRKVLKDTKNPNINRVRYEKALNRDQLKRFIGKLTRDVRLGGHVNVTAKVNFELVGPEGKTSTGKLMDFDVGFLTNILDEMKDNGRNDQFLHLVHYKSEGCLTGGRIHHSIFLSIA